MFLPFDPGRFVYFPRSSLSTGKSITSVIFDVFTPFFPFFFETKSTLEDPKRFRWRIRMSGVDHRLSRFLARTWVEHLGQNHAFSVSSCSLLINSSKQELKGTFDFPSIGGRGRDNDENTSNLTLSWEHLMHLR